MLNFYCSNAVDPESPFPNESAALLSVSVISDREESFADKIKFYPENQTGEGFREMVETVIGNPNITRVTLLNTAYLQRHRLALELLLHEKEQDLEQNLEQIQVAAEKFAIEDGYEWEKQNEKTIDLMKEKYGENFTILRWEDIIRINPGFSKIMQQVNALGDNSKDKGARSFQRAVTGLIEIIRNRISPNLKNKILGYEGQSAALVQKKIRFFLCKIVLEESAVRTLLDFSFEIYRGPINIPASIIYARFGKEGKMKFVSIGDLKEIQHYKRIQVEQAKQNNPSSIRRPLLDLSVDDEGDEKIEIEIIRIRCPKNSIASILSSLGINGIGEFKGNSRTSLQVDCIDVNDGMIDQAASMPRSPVT